MPSPLTQLIENYAFMRRQQGTRAALVQALQFLMLLPFEYRRSFALRKSLKEPVQIPELNAPIHIRQATLGDLALLGTIVPPIRVKRFAQRMEAGEICAVAIDGERVVAYVFAAFARTPSAQDSPLSLGPREFYLYAGYALPEYRRQGIVRAVNLSLCQRLRDEGYESALLLVERHNKAALGHCQKMGYSVTGKATYLRILGWKRRRFRPVSEQSPGL